MIKLDLFIVAGAMEEEVTTVSPLLSAPSATAECVEGCIFCGTALSASEKRKRCRTRSGLGEFVTKFCKPTDVVYPHLAQLSGEERLPLCIPCVNWLRRCAAGQRKRCAGQKPYLLADHFVLFMLEPGKVIIPDQRCALRLVCASATEECAKPLLSVMPVQVQVMVSMIGQGAKHLNTGNLVFELVRVWWEYNGRTVFFSHNLTAKLVRKMIKDY